MKNPIASSDGITMEATGSFAVDSVNLSSWSQCARIVFGWKLPTNVLPNYGHPERSEGSFATGTNSKDPVDFTIDVPLQFQGILRPRGAPLPMNPLLIAVMLSGVPSRAKVGRNGVEASRRFEMRICPEFHGILRLRAAPPSPSRRLLRMTLYEQVHPAQKS